MGKCFFFLLFWGLSFIANGQTPLVKEDVLQISGAHNFGIITQGRPVQYSFPIKNLGSEAIKIENVTASCGCTTPQWNKDPLEPGSSSSIMVGYNAAAEGKFEKSVTIYYNGGKTKHISIKGEVIKAQPSVPANSSLQLLKSSF